MTRKPHANEIHEHTEEQEIVAYLNQHKDFFARHPQLLAELSIPHTDSDRTISLIEKQVGLLRDKNAKLKRQLQNLVTTARSNEGLSKRLHAAYKALASVSTIDELVSALPDMVGRHFDVALVSVKLAGDTKNRAGPWSVDHPDRRYQKLSDRIAHGSSVCDDRLPHELLQFLFGDDARRVGSCAVVPLAGRKPIGLLALGAEEADRFRADLGTLYLDRLGEVAGTVIARLLT